MKISFKNKKIRELCEKQAAAIKKFGPLCARKLRSRLDDLEAAVRVSDLVAGNPHPLKGDRLGEFALDLAGGYRLTFKSADDPIPRHEDGGIDWTQVTIVCIEFIGDYHD